MRKNYFIYTLIVFLLTLSAQAQTWQWGKSGGSFEDSNSSATDEQAKSLITDANSNVYLLSPVGKNGLSVDGVEKEGFSNPDYMIASFSCSGDYRWSRVIGGGNADIINRLQTDNQNNIYAAGVIRRSQTVPGYFGTETQGVYDTILPYSASSINLNKQNLFLVKYNSEGIMQWLRMPQAADVTNAEVSQARSYDVQTDPQGNSYWLVSIPPGTYADGDFVNTAEGYNLFIFKYDSDGNFIESETLDMELESYTPNFKMVRNHNTGVFYVGGYKDSLTGQIFMGGQEVTSPMYLGAFDSEGDFLWIIENTGNYGTIQDLCTDNTNGIYLTGSTLNGDTFADANLNSPTGGLFPYIIKLNEQGSLIWSTNGSTVNSATTAYCIAINGNEVAITTGFGILNWEDQLLEQETNEGYDVMLARFNKDNGNLIEMTDIEGNPGYWDYGTSITADPLGNYYIGGKFDNFLYVNEETTLIDGAEGTDFFVAKYGTDNCDCAAPMPSFGFIGDTENSLAYTFTYTGDAYDTISWDFGDESATSTEANPAHTFTEPGQYNVCVTVTNTCGSEQHCQEITATLSTVNNVLAQVSVYPNPVKDILNITSAKELSYALYTLLGTKVASGTLEPNGQIDMAHTVPGMYLLELQGNDGSKKTLKVVKE